MAGWELDPATMMVAATHMGLDSLTQAGAVTGHVGDALGDEGVVEGGFAAIVVDIFAGAALLPALTEVSTWQRLRSRLRPDGLAIVNLGVLPADHSDPSHPTTAALNAMAQVFDGMVSCRQHASLRPVENCVEYHVHGV